MEQLDNSPEYLKFLENEFPEQAAEMSDPVSRRTFLNLMGASAAFAGLAACSKPVEKIVPYVKPPEEVIPGVAEYFATTMPMGTFPLGLLVKSTDGRPIKIEGNPLHPASKGGTHVFAQAELLNMYDPDRSKDVMNSGKKSTWGDFINAWRELYPSFVENRGKGLALISTSTASPSIARLTETYKKKFPQAQWFVYDSAGDDCRIAASKALFDKSAMPVYDLEKADVILSLDADLLMMEPNNARYARDFASRRNLVLADDNLNRLYVVEGDHSVTGANADHRLQVKTSQIGAFAVALAKALQSLGLNIDKSLPDIDEHAFDVKWINAVAKDLLHQKGSSLVAAGKSQPANVHTLVYAINEALGNIGNTLDFYPLTDQLVAQSGQLAEFTKACKAKQIDTVVMLGGNPVFDAPIDTDFENCIKSVKHSIHVSLYNDETSQTCEWHIPQAHFLESWGDAVTFDGYRSIVQPLILPLYNGHSELEVLNFIVNGLDDKGYDIVRKTWSGILSGSQFELQWDKVLHDGVYENNLNPISVSVNKSSLQKSLSELSSKSHAADGALQLLFKVSPTIYDGRYANNGWMQELPHPMTKITWDNPLQISPVLAKSKRLKNGDMVNLSVHDKSVELPVWSVPGLEKNTLVVTLGYGRKATGRISKDVGVDVNPLRTLTAFNLALDVKLEKTGKSRSLANTQDHGSMEGRPLVREGNLEEYKANPEFAQEMVEHPPLKNLWKDHKYDTGYQWGMIIDLNKCTGCNTCVVACQSENNIPIVGKKQVGNGREMHWIRLDRYFSGDPENPKVVNQPVTCHHCENAPCEQVCPVAATVHDKEGLNLMTYNRCVGTRYCSNNCPYKVRRFNFFNYHKKMEDQDKLMQNPDVTVRSRGVMEKCTFCLQRINAAKHTAKKEGRTLAPNEVKTACQQACPADAISFGNILDPESKVSKLRDNPRAYAMLGELNNRPRLMYLAKVRNPNPELIKTEPNDKHHG